MKVSTIRTLIVLAFGAFFSIHEAKAAFVDSPVPTNAYITFGGLEWAWADPCAPTAPTCGVLDLSYQATQGWRLPTLAEVLAGPAAANFVFAGANVPNGGTDPVSGAFNGYQATNGDLACSTPYFSNTWHHCDYGDQAQDGLYPTGNSAEETWVVRGAAVPEPSTLAIFAAGLAGWTMIRRRKTS